jgi:hypothetical protein
LTLDDTVLCFAVRLRSNRILVIYSQSSFRSLKNACIVGPSYLVQYSPCYSMCAPSKSHTTTTRDKPRGSEVAQLPQQSTSRSSRTVLGEQPQQQSAFFGPSSLVGMHPQPQPTEPAAAACGMHVQQPGDGSWMRYFTIDYTLCSRLGNPPTYVCSTTHPPSNFYCNGSNKCVSCRGMLRLARPPTLGHAFCFFRELLG